MIEQGHAVLVTGATGFIGPVVCARLLQLGYQVKVVVRDLERSKALPYAIERAVVPGISGTTDWADILAGAVGIIHLASAAERAGLGTGAQIEHLRSVNVEGSVRLAHAASAAGVRRFVNISTLKVNGETSNADGFGENDKPAPQGPYAISKWEAEQRLHEVAAQTGIELVTLRPPLVYGPGVKGNFLRLMNWIARGWPLPLASVHNRRSLIYVGNLVAAIVKALASPRAAGRTYLVNDGEDVSTPDLIRAVAHALDVTPRLFPCPVTLLKAGAAMLGRGDEIARLTGSLQVSSSRIGSELGWRPPFTLVQGLAETARWYRNRGER